MTNRIFRDELDDLKIQVKTENYQFSAEEWDQIENQLDSLKRLVKDFPVAELHVQIHWHRRSQTFHVKTNLHLLKQNLFTGERDVLWHPAYERCIRKLMNKVKGLKEKLAKKSVYSKVASGTLHQVIPEREPDPEKLEQAFKDQDFLAFRQAMSVYDDALSKRLGRWIERYPAVSARLGSEFTLSDLVEEVYLNAFEQFGSRPVDRIGNWLEHLIDPSVKAFIQHPELEKENLGYLEGLK
ncbi:MAG: hypothetical protein HY717_10370 [Planctomycetes bacterium]|nr:hypothetical protein [Planctomycetota bacterium]